MDEHVYVIIPAEQRQIASCFTYEECQSYGAGLFVIVGLSFLCCGVFLFFLITHHY